MYLHRQHADRSSMLCTLRNCMRTSCMVFSQTNRQIETNTTWRRTTLRNSATTFQCAVTTSFTRQRRSLSSWEDAEYVCCPFPWAQLTNHEGQKTNFFFLLSKITERTCLLVVSKCWLTKSTDCLQLAEWAVNNRPISGNYYLRAFNNLPFAMVEQFSHACSDFWAWIIVGASS